MSLGSSDHLQWAIPESEALPILKHAFDLGINTCDTVSSYLVLVKRVCISNYLHLV